MVEFNGSLAFKMVYNASYSFDQNMQPEATANKTKTALGQEVCII